MATDHYTSVAFKLPYKTHQAVVKLAAEYGLSRANTLMMLVEEGLKHQGERLEVTTTNTEGVRRANGVPGFVNNGLRKLL